MWWKKKRIMLPLVVLMLCTSHLLVFIQGAAPWYFRNKPSELIKDQLACNVLGNSRLFSQEIEKIASRSSYDWDTIHSILILNGFDIASVSRENNSFRILYMGNILVRCMNDLKDLNAERFKQMVTFELSKEFKLTIVRYACGSLMQTGGEICLEESPKAIYGSRYILNNSDY
jgi:hypothetical protein